MEKGARGTEVLAQTNVMFQRAECDAYLARLSANSLRVSGRGKSEVLGSLTELVGLWHSACWLREEAAGS